MKKIQDPHLWVFLTSTVLLLVGKLDPTTWAGVSMGVLGLNQVAGYREYLNEQPGNCSDGDSSATGYGKSDVGMGE